MRRERFPLPSGFTSSISLSVILRLRLLPVVVLLDAATMVPLLVLCIIVLERVMVLEISAKKNRVGKKQNN